jgi:hypothetical protein
VSDRVLVTRTALEVASDLRARLQQLQSAVQQVIAVGDQLARPEAWDGPVAVDYRQGSWPQTRGALRVGIQSLEGARASADAVVHAVYGAGSSGDVVAASGGVVTGSTPPDAKVRQALDYFHHHVDGGNFFTGNRGDMEGIDKQLQGMTPEEINDFLASLSQADLREWNKQIATSGGFLFHQDGLSGDDKIALTNTLYRSADPEELARLQQYMPALEPNESVDKVTTTGWQSGANLPLWDPGTSQPQPEGDINQGQDGDCWFLAGLGAVAEQNPQFIRDHVQANPNGTYTVTFYKDGHPVTVTVTDDFPKGTNGWDGYTYSHTYGSDTAQWAMIYEKAYAEFKGGYGSINGGWSDVALNDLTGQNATSTGTGGESLADVNDKLHQGYAIASSTQRQWPWDGEMENSPSGNIVREHQYYVQGVNMNAQPPTITLVNPWGWGGNSDSPAAPQYITLTEKQWHDYFDGVQYAQVPKQ